MKLAEVVPWGRSRREYERMFGLTATDLTKRILGVGDGPASFNAEMALAGHNVTSIDPIYAFSASELRERIGATHQTIAEQLKCNVNQYVWTDFQNAEAVIYTRMEAMSLFLSDYEQGLQQERYIPISLPDLPFPDSSYDLVLCSHLLFLYSEQLSEAFHLTSIKELVRVANDVRIFPLVTLDGHVSPHLNSVLEYCKLNHIQADIIPVDYQFQKGACQMLRLLRKSL